MIGLERVRERERDPVKGQQRDGMRSAPCWVMSFSEINLSRRTSDGFKKVTNGN